MNTIIPATGWIPTSEASEMIASFTASHNARTNGMPTRKFKKSSYRWADPKDHSKGYLCRVLIEVLNGDKIEPTETITAKVEKKSSDSDGVSAAFKKRCAGMTVDELAYLANNLELTTERAWDILPARKRNANIRMARYATNLMKSKQAAAEIA